MRDYWRAFLIATLSAVGTYAAWYVIEECAHRARGGPPGPLETRGRELLELVKARLQLEHDVADALPGVLFEAWDATRQAAPSEERDA